MCSSIRWLFVFSNIVIVPIILIKSCYCEEIVATKEWRLLKENDTVPPGLHIKMDLSTGEKYAKLIDDEDGEGKEKQNKHSLSEKSEILKKEVSVDGSLVIVENDSDNHEELADEDVIVIHRTLSQLPEDEKERIGGIPELPPPLNSMKYSKEQYEAFQEKMRSVWKERQKELLELQDQLADFPKLLKNRINSLISYVDRGYIHSPNDIVGDVTFVLEDLEYQLSDIDMSRDFHTLGGWKVLMSLLVDQSHTNATLTYENNTKNDNFYPTQLIQSKVALVMGTAVKNTEEFQVWIFEKSEDGFTALSLILDRIKYYSDCNIFQGRFLYALGAFLRANTLAQQDFFTELEGLDILYQTVQSCVEHQQWKVFIKLYSLLQDLLSEKNMHLTLDNMDPLCHAFAQTLVTLRPDHDCNVIVDVSFQEKILHSMQILLQFCNKKEFDGGEKLMGEWIKCWLDNDEIDRDWRVELINVVQNITQNLVLKSTVNN